MDTVYQRKAPRSITDSDRGAGLLLFDLEESRVELEGVRKVLNPRGVAPGLFLGPHDNMVRCRRAPLPSFAIVVKFCLIAVRCRVAGLLALFEARPVGSYDRMLNGGGVRLDNCSR